jgi:hypothetical protein
MRKLDKEFDIHPPKWIIKLPCGHGSVEVTKPEDQYITCGQCLKQFLLVWSKIGKHKIQGEL